MKKLAAILLIALFVFNLFGYRLLFNYAQQQSDIRLEASLDKEQYNESDLITIKVPLSVPYQNDQADFERVNGEITYQGKLYKYVKRKMSGGQLVLQCLPNQNKMHLQSAKNDFFKFANDLVQNNHSKSTGHSKDVNLKNIVSDYIAFDDRFQSLLFVVEGKFAYTSNNAHLPSFPHQSPWQPPEVL